MTETTSRFMRVWLDDEKRKSTEDLLSYSSISAKDDVFGINNTYRSATKFMYFWYEELPELITNRRFIFRGVNEASFRLFSKAQRNFIRNKYLIKSKNPLYHDLIKEMIYNAKNTNNSLLSKYFKAFGVPLNDISILSFLQHYGAPTPLLDWTNNFDIALFFATSSFAEKEVQKFYMRNPCDEVDGYFSIYLLDLDTIKAYTKDFGALNKKTRRTNNYEKLSRKKMAYIAEEYQNDRPQFILENNLNIISQNGLFIYNNSPTLPLEEVVRKYSLLYYSIASDLRGEENVLRSPLICINVYKGIIHLIRKKLQERNIHFGTVFPKPEEVAQNSVPIMLT